MEYKVVPPNKWDKSKWRVLPVLTYDPDRRAQQSTGMQVGVDLLMMRKVKGSSKVCEPWWLVALGVARVG